MTSGRTSIRHPQYLRAPFTPIAQRLCPCYRDRMKKRIRVAIPLLVLFASAGCDGKPAEKLRDVCHDGREIGACETLCNQGDAWSCRDAALLSGDARGISRPADLARELYFYQRACDIDPEFHSSCCTAAISYACNTGVPDEKLARRSEFAKHYAERACSEKDKACCAYVEMGIDTDEGQRAICSQPHSPPKPLKPQP